ncbi:MAG: sulfatase-like hydrolase/transferase [Candidatus Eisenbacteria sp.]|nr:sulfatase-like hydrolase/transferase [Candidatus Eisenbacteria bacterium]
MTEAADRKHPMAEAVRAAYRRGEDDEAMLPLVKVDESGNAVGKIRGGDYVIFYDIRGEREIQLTECFTDPGFSHFSTPSGLLAHFATMIQYDPNLGVKVAFPPVSRISDTLCEVVTRSGLKLARISESEKAVHISYFLGGRRDEQFPNEDRVAIPSPEHEVNYDEIPEMSAAGVADAVIERIEDPSCGLIIANFANVDVVGHIENEKAILQAVASADEQVGRVVDAAKAAGVTTIITADHGTVEKWRYPEGAIDTGHTDSLVPFILVSPGGNIWAVRESGELADVAPTVLELLGLDKPDVMTGQSLLEGFNGAESSPRVLLVIVDGWGLNDDEYGNMIMKADTPVMDRLQRDCPFARLEAAGEAVGMPAGAVGNSESGHLHLGAGRRVYSDRVRIDKAIEDGSFLENDAFVWAMEGARRDGTRLHLLGIISFYSSHGSIDHLMPLMQMAKERGVPEVYIHGLLGRRGERPESGARYIGEVEAEAGRLGLGEVVTVIGRYWALDREYNWDRVEKTYRALVHGEGTAVR